MEYTFNSNNSKYIADYEELSVEDKKYWTERRYFAMREFISKYCKDPLSNLILAIQVDKTTLTSERFKPISYALSESIGIDHSNKDDVIIKDIFDSILLDVYKIDDRLALINDLVEDIINDKNKE
ncbi:hypothetical protein [Paenibacillus xylanexedens]|uniref:hypothetical protein n=1 Tax=Paenibacillus xylanexedens TaxID=528191 RepID=UPI000F52C096|nr:hypothetical protein [Paenibacillus xylanexedens]RPK23997.1 hypothetical protein EDO6_04935 [Paenibacillus xylanexedens]